MTGSSGFIGTNLLQYLGKIEPETEMVLLDIAPPQTRIPGNAKFVFADIRNLQSLLEPLRGCEEIYHLPVVLGTSELIPVTGLACEVNVVGACNVMDAVRQVAAPGAWVYNVAKPHFEGVAENAYTLTNHAGEPVGQKYQRKFGREVANVRWLDAVGPYQHLYPVRKFLPVTVLLAMVVTGILTWNNIAALGGVHFAINVALFFLVLGHAAAAICNQLLRKDRTLRRMIPAIRKRPSEGVAGETGAGNGPAKGGPGLGSRSAAR